MGPIAIASHAPARRRSDLVHRQQDGEKILAYRVSGKGSDQQLDSVQCRYHY
jgi:hypothetical protein